MQTTFTDVSSITIIVSTILLLFFAALVVNFLFLYQRKRYRHQKELMELREAFNQTLLQSKLEIQEQTLDHIAKELHANFSHLVSLININLAEILPQSSETMKESVSETKSLAKQLLSELKALSASLNTDHIMQIGFGKAIDNEIKRLSKRYVVTISKTGSEFRLRPEHEIILFRLCQEILNNIVRYSNAKTITITMFYGENKALKLSIGDDGVGFDTNCLEEFAAEKESTGFLNMKKRAKLINADILIESKIGQGTVVSIIIREQTSIKHNE